MSKRIFQGSAVNKRQDIGHCPTWNEGHVPTSEIEIFVAKAIVAKGSILDVGRSSGYTSDCYYHIFKKPSGVKNIKVNKVYF